MRILLAYDAQPAADGAVRRAISLAKDAKVAVEVIRVLEPYPVYGVEVIHGAWAPAPHLLEGRGEAAMDQVNERLEAFGPTTAAWPVHVEIGPVPFMIAQAAESRGASLIVMGSGRHGRLDRWFGTETALRVMQISHVPVLAIPPDAGDPPEVIVAAADFSDFSRDAVAHAIQLAGPDATVHIAHVLWERPTDLPAYQELPRPAELREQVRSQLDDWLAGIDGIADVRTEIHLLEGGVADELLGLAKRVGADLIAAGTHGMGFLGRLMLGSVATRLLRGADCSVLITPPRQRARELETLPLQNIAPIQD